MPDKSTAKVYDASPSDLTNFASLINEAFPGGHEYNGPITRKSKVGVDGWTRPDDNLSFSQALPVTRVKHVIEVLKNAGSRSFEHLNNPSVVEMLESEHIAATLQYHQP